MQRMATLGLVVWNVLMVGWTATYLGGIGDCAHESGWSLTVCETGRSIGIEIGFPFILVVWIVGLAAFAAIWLRGRPA
jgi:hypothetical protein